MSTATTLLASSPKTVAWELREQLAGTPRSVSLKPYNYVRSHDTIYWLTRHSVPVAHHLAKGMVMPYDVAGAPKRLLVGFYLEKGFEDFAAAPDLKLFMDETWDWHVATADPSRLDEAAKEMVSRGGEAVVVLRTGMGTLHFTYGAELTCTLREDAKKIEYCAQATSLSALLVTLKNTPGVEQSYVDLIVGHSFELGADMGITAAELERRSLRPWQAWIWSAGA